MFSRMISYIYSSDAGRGGNLGFVVRKVNDGVCRIEIRAEGILTGEMSERRYLTGENADGRAEIGFYVWNDGVARCSILQDFAPELELNSGDVLGVTLENIGGVLIKSQNKLYVAEWQDVEFDFDRMVWAESLAAPVVEVSVEDDEDVLVAQSVDNMPAIELPDFLKKKKCRDHDMEINNWKDMFKIYDYADPFNDDMINSCIEIGYEDIKYLPSSCRNVAKNSFLLHGLYLHKHLLIGKFRCKKRQKIYVLGVPGQYGTSENVVAGMFGFDNFKEAKREGAPAGFGYWYTLFKDDEINE